MSFVKVGDIIYGKDRVKDCFSTFLITGGRGYKVLGISSSSTRWFLIENDFGIINWYDEVYFDTVCESRCKKLNQLNDRLNYMKEVKIGDMIYYINDDYAQFDIRLTLNKGYKVRGVFIGHTFEVWLWLRMI